MDVTMFTVKDFSIDSYHVTLVNDANCRGVRLEAESFRDHLIPGTQETWSFRVVDKNGNGVQSALLLDVYNKALDELEAQYIRSPNFLRRDIGGTSYMITPGHIGSLSSRVNSMYKMLDTGGLFKPQFDYYGYGLDFRYMVPYTRWRCAEKDDGYCGICKKKTQLSKRWLWSKRKPWTM